MPATDGEELPAEGTEDRDLSSPAKVSASLPNGVRLTLECGDANALAAIIGSVGDVKLGADLQVYLHREPIDFRAGINSLGSWFRDDGTRSICAGGFCVLQSRREPDETVVLRSVGFCAGAEAAWPRTSSAGPGVQETVMRLTTEHIALILDGIDIDAMCAIRCGNTQVAG